MSIQDDVSRAARKLGRTHPGATLAAILLDTPQGKGFAWAADNATVADIETAAVMLLAIVEGEAAKGALDCDDCAARLARVKAAIASLQNTPAPDRAHVH